MLTYPPTPSLQGGGAYTFGYYQYHERSVWDQRAGLVVTVDEGSPSLKEGAGEWVIPAG